MAITRAPDYKDLDLTFTPHPVTGDLVKKIGVDSIKRAVKQLILTNFYERPFRSYIGSNASKMLFENINPLTATFLKNAIVEVITNFEPRVTLLGVDIKVTQDQNAYQADIIFTVNNRPEPQILNLILQRIR